LRENPGANYKQINLKKINSNAAPIIMNTPNPLLPQGTLPQRGKSGIYFKVLMIVAIHTVVICGLLMVGCKDATKDHASTTPDDTATAANTASNSTPMSTDLPAPVVATPAPITAPAQPVASTALPPVTPVVTPVAAPVTPVVAAAPTPGVAKEYVIASGDLLSTIAKKNGVSLKALEEANPGLDPKKLRIGNKIQIPAAVATVSSTSSGASSSSSMADANASASGDATSYTVKSGDNLTKVAKSHGTTVKAILALNDMKTTSIKAGQKLKLPVMKVASADTAPSAMGAPAPATPAPIDAPAAPTALKATAN
jgi:LysM repeat protein